jgi:putative endonuclease
MSRNQELGKLGEDWAAQFLMKKGIQILERNWRSGRNELDLIAQKEDTILFIEVKTRRGRDYGEPEQAVNFKKEESIRKASLEYMLRVHFHGEIRYDIISLILDNQNEVREILHLEDAFFPGL